MKTCRLASRQRMLYTLAAALVIATLFASFACASPAGSNDRIIGIHRIVAVGDVHGDAEQLRAIMEMSDLVEASPKQSKNKKEVRRDGEGKPTPVQDKLKWNPRYDGDVLALASLWNFTPRTTFVQMGDLVDRGEQDLQVLTMISDLKDSTKGHPSDKVVLLMGNHELMNLMGQFHYVHPDSMSGFLTRHLRKTAFAHDGLFGSYMLDEMKIAHVEARTLFVHAGLSRQHAKLGVDHLNKESISAIREKNYRHKLLSSSGPLWTRTMIMDGMNGQCAEVDDIVRILDVDRIVVGHTPQRSGKVELYCDDKLVAIDVGLSKWMYGNIAALEITEITRVSSETNKISSEVILREIVPSSSHSATDDTNADEPLNDPILLQEMLDAVRDFENTKESNKRAAQTKKQEQEDDDGGDL